MRKVLTLTILAVMFSAVGLAATWSGALLDATCYERQNQQLNDIQKAADACAASDTTSAFAIHATGKVFKLDAAGNTKTKAALSNRADRAEPGQAQSKSIMAKVEGTESGGTIRVDSVEVQ